MSYEPVPALDTYQRRGDYLAQIAQAVSKRGAASIRAEEHAHDVAERDAPRRHGRAKAANTPYAIRRRLHGPWREAVCAEPTCALTFGTTRVLQSYCSFDCKSKAHERRRNLIRVRLPRLWLRVGRIMWGGGEL
jgi:hypothetical protein